MSWALFLRLFYPDVPFHGTPPDGALPGGCHVLEMAPGLMVSGDYSFIRKDFSAGLEEGEEGK